MAQMLDDSTKEYFDIKFGDVINEIKDTTKRNTSDIIAIERKADKQELKHDSHIDWHNKKDNNNKFNIQQFLSLLAIIVAIFVAFKFM